MKKHFIAKIAPQYAYELNTGFEKLKRSTFTAIFKLFPIFFNFPSFIWNDNKHWSRTRTRLFLSTIDFVLNIEHHDDNHVYISLSTIKYELRNIPAFLSVNFSWNTYNVIEFWKIWVNIQFMAIRTRSYFSLKKIRLVKNSIVISHWLNMLSTLAGSKVSFQIIKNRFCSSICLLCTFVSSILLIIIY